jgi:hypothetical protein
MHRNLVIDTWEMVCYGRNPGKKAAHDDYVLDVTAHRGEEINFQFSV